MMPDSVRDLFDRIHLNVTEVHAEWMLYRKLFDGDEDDRQLLKLASPTFDYIHNALVAGIILALCRLTDPPGEGSRENVSLNRLAVVLHEEGAIQLSDQVRWHAEEATEQCNRFRIHRNKRLTHSDHASMQGGFQQTLPRVTKMMVIEALSSMRDCLHTVQAYYHLEPFPYVKIDILGAGDELLLHLRRSRAYTQRVNRGEIDPRQDDLGC
jgi:AbiU2